MLLVTRRRRFAEGVECAERASAAAPDDPGAWYTLGWLSEFAAHEIERRPGPGAPDPAGLFRQASEAFRRCLALDPGGKLRDDAEDLLELVERRLEDYEERA